MRTKRVKASCRYCTRTREYEIKAEDPDDLMEGFWICKFCEKMYHDDEGEQ